MNHSRTLELDFSSLEFFDHYVISRLKDGVVFDKPQVEKLAQVLREHYQGRKFVYISQRVNNYSVNPIIYLKLEDAENFCGIAIVSQRTSALNTAAFEKNFARVPFEVFLELKDAIAWAIKKVKG